MIGSLMVNISTKHFWQQSASLSIDPIISGKFDFDIQAEKISVFHGPKEPNILNTH